MQRSLRRALRAWACAGACLLGASALGCEGESAADDEGSGAGAGTSGAQSPVPSAGAPSGGGTPATTTAAGAGSGGAVGSGAPDLPPPLPPCAMAPIESDAGVSPYDGTCIDERVGVFASPSGDVAPAADGSRSRPFRSLQDAVGLAVREGRDVYACAGTYEGVLQVGTELSDGLKLFGGLSCDDFSVPDESGARSVVHARGAAAALRIDGCHGVSVERFELHADRAESPEPGAGYIAVSVTNASGVELRDVVLRTADGEKGADGETAEGMAASGADGGDGQDACARNPNPGGTGALQTACGAMSNAYASGGAGGVAGVGTGDAGGGFQQSFPATQGEIDNAAGTWSCAEGVGTWYPPALVVSPGNAGRGGRGFGALLGGRFIGYGGQAGADGPSGMGGVGGGGARAPASCPSLAAAVGASGGGGGAGGCGGEGGTGGGAGGSSIALLVLDAEVVVRGGELHVGRGGAGGLGAVGQPGGAGGKGGKAGQGVSSSSDACVGTAGSAGSAGGPGGGGNGGHAIGVLYDGTMPELEDVSGEIEAATDWGGAPGEGPDGAAEPMLGQLLGTPGVTAWVRPF